MNCHDISRALDSTDVNTLSAAERTACDAHAVSCPQCGPEWVVYSRLAALSAPPMPQRLAAQCEALAASHLKVSDVRRLPRGTLLLGSMLVVAAAAAMLADKLVNPSTELTSAPPASAPMGTQARAPAAADSGAGASRADPEPEAMPAAAVTVSIELNQATDDVAGRAFGQQVYDRAREELRALAGVEVVNAGMAAPATALRITLLNATKAGGSFSLDSSGIPVATPPTGDQPLLFHVFLRFKFGAVQAGTEAPSPDLSASRFDVVTFVPPECLGRPAAGGCTGPTASEIAASSVLSWRLASTAPDATVEKRLHAALRDSSEQFLRRLAFSILGRYKMLRLDDLRVTIDLIANDSRNPSERDEWLATLTRSGSGREVMNEVQDLLLRQLPNGDRAAGIAVRESLVTLLTTVLKDEPAARATLEAVADTDPNLDVRAEAGRALGVE